MKKSKTEPAIVVSIKVPIDVYKHFVKWADNAGFRFHSSAGLQAIKIACGYTKKEKEVQDVEANTP